MLAEFFPVIVASQVAWIWAQKRRPGFLEERKKKLCSSRDSGYWRWLVISVEEIDLYRRIRKIKELCIFWGKEIGS